MALTQVSGGLISSLPAGSVVQVVSANYGTYFSTSSTSYVSTGYTASITPKFATSKILVVVQGNQFVTAGNATMSTIFRNSTNISPNSGAGMGVCYTSGSGFVAPLSMVVLDSPATTSATTYGIYSRVSSGGAASIGDGQGSITVTLMEIAA